MRECEVIRLLARGLSNPQIAATLVISRKTVEHHHDHVYGKIGVTSRTAAVA
jgi:DNA-binding NarL/FixJ family response regulator